MSLSRDCTIYNADGLITQTGNFSPETLELYSTMGFLGLVDVLGDPKTQYVSNERLMQYTAEEEDALANLQPGWVWKMPEKVAVDKRALEITRAETQTWVNNKRDELIAAFDRFTYNGMLFDGNAAAAENIDVAAKTVRAGIALPPGFEWRLFDNTDVPFTAEDVLGMEKAYLEAANLYRYTCHEIARSLKAQADQAGTPGALDALKEITWVTS